jgi:hypothetical protein
VQDKEAQGRLRFFSIAQGRQAVAEAIESRSRRNGYHSARLGEALQGGNARLRQSDTAGGALESRSPHMDEDAGA